jgi:hypothetical protein
LLARRLVGEDVLAMFGLFKRGKREAVEARGTTCLWCRRLIPAEGNEALFLAGAVLDPGAGWFCCEPCATQYRLRFHVIPANPPSPANSHR